MTFRRDRNERCWMNDHQTPLTETPAGKRSNPRPEIAHFRSTRSTSDGRCRSRGERTVRCGGTRGMRCGPTGSVSPGLHRRQTCATQIRATMMNMWGKTTPDQVLQAQLDAIARAEGAPWRERSRCAGWRTRPGGAWVTTSASGPSRPAGVGSACSSTAGDRSTSPSPATTAVTWTTPATPKASVFRSVLKVSSARPQTPPNPPTTHGQGRPHVPLTSPSVPSSVCTPGRSRTTVRSDPPAAAVPAQRQQQRRPGRQTWSANQPPGPASFTRPSNLPPDMPRGKFPNDRWKRSMPARTGEGRPPPGTR